MRPPPADLGRRAWLAAAAPVALSFVLLGLGSAARAQKSQPARPGWIELPSLATAVPASGAVTRRHGSGNPTRGIYLFEQDLALPGTTQPAALVPLVLKDLGKKGFALDHVTETGADFAFRGKHGRLRVSQVGGRARAVTCFYNEREPERSARECETLLGSNP